MKPNIITAKMFPHTLKMLISNGEVNPETGEEIFTEFYNGMCNAQMKMTVNDFTVGALSGYKSTYQVLTPYFNLADGWLNSTITVTFPDEGNRVVTMEPMAAQMTDLGNIAGVRLGGSFLCYVNN